MGKSRMRVWHVAAIGVVLFAFGAYGWVRNLIILFHSTGFGGTEIARAIGVPVFPLGAVLGYF